MSEERILNSLKTLYPHCRHYMSRTPDEVLAFLGGYLKVLERRFGDLYRHPEAAGWVERVCENWLDRLSEHGRQFPTPDQVRDLACAYQPRTQNPGNEPWRHLSAAEYDALPLWAKARHCRILAMEYSGRAGPMHVHGQGEGPVLPNRFARYTALAAECLAEANRLEGLVRRARAQGAAAKAPPRLAPDAPVTLPFRRVS